MRTNLEHSAATLLGAATILILLTVPAMSRANVDGDVRAGVMTNSDGVGVGAGILTPLGDRNDRWYANPNAEVAVSGDNMFSLNGDFHYDVSHQSTTSIWLGAGPAIIRQDHHGDSETNLGMNVLAGVGKTRGSMRPYGQFKGVISDNSGVALMGGIRF